jgi:hypothetical protein
MKYIYFAITVAICFICCEKFNKSTQFHIIYPERVSVSENLEMNVPVDLIIPNIETNHDFYFSANNTNFDLAQSIHYESIVFNVISPDGADFSFLKSVEVFLNVDGLPEIKVASIDEVPEAVSGTFGIDGLENNIKEYLAKDKFSLRVVITTDMLLTQKYSISILQFFLVDALVL